MQRTYEQTERYQDDRQASDECPLELLEQVVGGGRGSKLHVVLAVDTDAS